MQRIEPFEFDEALEGFSEQIREVSECGRLVAVVGIKSTGHFTYSLHFWDLTDSEYLGGGAWSPCGGGGIFMDFEEASAEARRELAAKGARNEI